MIALLLPGPRRPRPLFESDTPPGGTPPPAKVEAAEAAVDKAEAAVETAKATGDPKAITTAEARLKAAEDRLAKLETDYAAMRQAHESKADANHSHEMPAELKALHEHLRDVEAEETPPARRRHWLYRRIGAHA